MQFSQTLGLGPAGSADAFKAAVARAGGEVKVGDPAPDTGLVPLRPTGPALAAAGFQRLTAFERGGRIVRVLAATAPTSAQELEQRFGPPQQVDDRSGFRLWAFEAPRWSVEARPAPEGGGWGLEAKFLEDAVDVGVLSKDYVDGLYARLSS